MLDVTRGTESDQCTIRVDDRPAQGPRGASLMEVLNRDEDVLPYLCWHPSLGTPKTCDVCWVERDGELVRGCTLRFEDGLKIGIDTPLALAARREGVRPHPGQARALLLGM
jgi:formate dehydrogenase major subunit